MQKIGVLLAAMTIIGFANAQGWNCDTSPTMKDLHKCCYQREINLYDYIMENCYKEYADTPYPQYCATQCSFSQRNISYPDGTINFDGYLKYLEDQVKDPVLIEFMMKIVQDCQSHVQEVMVNTEESKPCCQFGYLVKQCSASQGILNCPRDKFFWEDAYCEEIFKETESCQNLSYTTE